MRFPPYVLHFFLHFSRQTHTTADRISSFADEEAGPRSPLLSAQTSRSLSMSAQPPVSLEQREKEFVEALDSELAKIIRFYLKKEAEINAKFQELSMQVQHAEGIQPEQQAAGEGGGCRAVWLACWV